MASWSAEGRIYFVSFVLNVNKVKKQHIKMMMMMMMMMIIIT